MKSPRIWVAILLAAVLFACARSTAPANDLISGQWDAVFHFAGSDPHYTLQLKLDGKKLTGRVTTPEGEEEITGGEWSGGKLHLMFHSMHVTGELQDGRLVGEFDSGGEMNGAWSATRKP